MTKAYVIYSCDDELNLEEIRMPNQLRGNVHRVDYLPNCLQVPSKHLAHILIGALISQFEDIHVFLFEGDLEHFHATLTGVETLFTGRLHSSSTTSTGSTG